MTAPVTYTLTFGTHLLSFGNLDEMIAAVHETWLAANLDGTPIPTTLVMPRATFEWLYLIGQLNITKDKTYKITAVTCLDGYPVTVPGSQLMK